MEKGNEGDEIILLAFRQIEWFVFVLFFDIADVY